MKKSQNIFSLLLNFIASSFLDISISSLYFFSEIFFNLCVVIIMVNLSKENKHFSL